mgnify:CR=1 FL=1
MRQQHHTVGQNSGENRVFRVANSLTWHPFEWLLRASTEPSPPLWRAHERRMAGASAHRSARPLVVLGTRFLGTSLVGVGSCRVPAAALAALPLEVELAAPPGRSLDGSAVLAYLQPEDGGDRRCCRRAATERRLRRRSRREIGCCVWR